MDEDIIYVCDACGTELSTKPGMIGGKPTLEIEACENCLDEKHDEGYDEGYDKGHDDGVASVE